MGQRMGLGFGKVCVFPDVVPLRASVYQITLLLHLITTAFGVTVQAVCQLRKILFCLGLATGQCWSTDPCHRV